MITQLQVAMTTVVMAIVTYLVGYVTFITKMKAQIEENKGHIEELQAENQKLMKKLDDDHESRLIEFHKLEMSIGSMQKDLLYLRERIDEKWKK